jgi:hypothetical protein
MTKYSELHLTLGADDEHMINNKVTLFVVSRKMKVNLSTP